ncbi:hypothetical protein SNOG_13982 [Parastagonospora nodorum SN15]|uniref:Uncharacterized protein n=1 Tax=Phaeosphaeria nodorum (strain SN15 / ATCC MYA-4574 / FGSC 10173) TaxID=321614 RepID=Q0U2V4_PHANO|nr:hypothetical protein SNOG_13982 [Parastagonospora nodorum SN15]EAT78607.1 hypothetical protein SNOG_13982 [Parastagonospora nodorum SN15]
MSLTGMPISLILHAGTPEVWSQLLLPELHRLDEEDLPMCFESLLELQAICYNQKDST